MKKILFILLIINLFAFKAIASDWKYLSDGIYIDIQSVQKYSSFWFNSPYYKVFWLKFADDGSIKGLKRLNSFRTQYDAEIDNVKVKYIIDCNQRKYAVMGFTIYYKSENENIYNYNISELNFDWQSIPPDAIFDYVCNIICPLNNNN